MTRARTSTALWIGIGVGLALATPAHALEDYADAIARELGLPDKPSCLYCHDRDDAGLATDTPFNDALKDRGFTRRMGVSSLLAALRELDADDADTDGDGVADVAELRAGANPNDPSDAGKARAGCAIGGADTGASWLGAVGIVLWARRRRIVSAP